MKLRHLFLGVLALPFAAHAQQAQPIIDMHLHAVGAASQGPPPLALCLPVTTFGSTNTGAAWGPALLAGYKNPSCSNPIWSAASDDALLDATLAIMERRNIIGVTSGPLLPRWRERAASRFIPGTIYFHDGGPNSPTVEILRQRIQEGAVRVLAEVTLQYRGKEPGDPAFEPYLALAEEMDIPVGIHMGPGPPGAPYLGRSSYLARLSSPLLLEDVLVRHPRLRIYVMHAGWPMLDDLLALMWTHPQVHVDLGVISFALPPAEFHRYLRTIVEAGFGERVMFGSDQMIWPEAIGFGIDNIEGAGYLSENQKRDILYNNAARFLKLSQQEIDAHHGR
jgi:predicted TIM-barrel fold metal-dependent hydrolase